MTRHWIEYAPSSWRPFLLLSRYDRPVGTWLLVIPCWLSLALVRMEEGIIASDLVLALLLLIGAFAMRGAGCTWNDLLDRDLDAAVERTRDRPLAAGNISPLAALLWLGLQCVPGVLILLILPVSAQLTALAALPLVALYPLMKRVTFWPQLWLGLTFNWGALIVAMTLRGELVLADIMLYLALVCWTVGYDTIYALQDKHDDAKIGIKSTALLFGARVKMAVAICYILTFAGLVAAVGSIEPGGVIFGAALAWQVWRLAPEMGQAALPLFVSNVRAGLILVMLWSLLPVQNFSNLA